MNRKSIVVIPAFNEETTVGTVVANCAKFCDVLVVNDGSTDNTSIAASFGGAIVITNYEKKGYEYSLNVAYKYAVTNKYSVMITMDADGQLPTDMLSCFLKAIEEGASVVIGNRLIKPRVSEKILAFLAKRLSCLNDPYCGMKAYCLEALNRSEFSKYNSIGTSLSLDYIEARLPCENIDIDIASRSGKSKFGGRLSSELKLFPSMAIGSFRLLKTWLKS